MKIQVLAIGKKPDRWLNDALEDYTKRLRGQFVVEVEIVPPSRQKDDTARLEDSTRLLRRIKRDDFVILLDERGQIISSPELSSLITSCRQDLVFIIGGAYGVDDRLRQRADFVWSLSKLVFPHQIVRLILIEQIYRAQEIDKGGRYHHS